MLCAFVLALERGLFRRQSENICCYHYRVVNQSHRGGLFGADKSRIYYGNLFTNKKVELLYYVYVKNKDYEDARYLLDCNHI